MCELSHVWDSILKKRKKKEKKKKKTEFQIINFNLERDISVN